MTKVYIDHLINNIKIKKAQLDSIKFLVEKKTDYIYETIKQQCDRENIDYCDIFTVQTRNDYVNAEEYKSDTLSNLYKKLCLKSHPDKTGDTGDEIFITIKKAYDEEDILTLMDYATKYEINDFNHDEIFLELERYFHKLKTKIKNIKIGLGYNIIVDYDNGIKLIKSCIETYKDVKKLEKENEALRHHLATVSKTKLNL